MKNKTLLIILAAVVVAGSLTKKEPADARHVILADICEAFAYNLDADGQRKEPRLKTAGDVGALFDDFGRRSTLGISYKKQFPGFFKGLGAELARAAGPGREAGAAPLTPELREQFVAIFLRAARSVP